jgi:hypothetical protein
MLGRLGESGFSTKVNTLLGDVFNFSDKNKVSLLDNLSAILNDDSEKSKRAKGEYIGNNIKFRSKFYNSLSF